MTQKPENVTCPECGEPMVSRANKTTGQRFWGCSNYPSCKGTRDTDGESTRDKEPNRQSRRWEGFSGGSRENLFPNVDGLREFLKSNDKELCEDCGCCERVSEPCEQCGGDGYFGHECGEDTCCCLDPEENETCNECGGLGYFKHCLGNCGENGHTRGTDEAEGQP